MKLFKKRKPQSARRISSARRRVVMRKLRPVLRKVESKDRQLAKLSNEIAKLSSRPFTRSVKRMKLRVKANVFAEREILLAEVARFEALLDGYNSKNLSIAKKR